VKRSNHAMANRKTGALWALILTSVLSGNACRADIASVQRPVTSDIRVMIENIHYEGEDSYLLVVSVTNASPKDVLLQPVEEGFFIQTNHGWAHLEILNNRLGPKHENIIVPHSQKKEMVSLIGIPQTIPDLFRTYEGDLSVKYKYTYAIRTWENSAAAFQRSDEVYCWLRPGTSQWILREGM